MLNKTNWTKALSWKFYFFYEKYHFRYYSTLNVNRVTGVPNAVNELLFFDKRSHSTNEANYHAFLCNHIEKWRNQMIVSYVFFSFYYQIKLRVFVFSLSKWVTLILYSAIKLCNEPAKPKVQDGKQNNIRGMMINCSTITTTMSLTTLLPHLCRLFHP